MNSPERGDKSSANIKNYRDIKIKKELVRQLVALFNCDKRSAIIQM